MTEVLEATGHPIKVESKNWPIHAKHIPEFRVQELIERAKKLVPDSRHLNDLTTALKVWETDEIFKSVAEPRPEHLTMRFTTEELGIIMYADHIEKAIKGQGIGWVRMFPLDEVIKIRRRVITHSTTANKIQRLIQLHLNSVASVQKIVQKGTIAVTLDLKQWYAAFVMPEHVRDGFSFYGLDGIRYRWKRMPAGWTHSADIAHPATELLVEVAKAEANFGDNKAPDTRVHIDNIIVAGKYETVRIFVEKFLDVARLYQAEVNEGKTVDEIMSKAGSKIDFIGHYLNFAEKKIGITTKTRTKANIMLKYIEDVLSRTNIWKIKFIACAYGLGAFWHTVIRSHNQTGLADFWKLNYYYANMARDLQAERYQWTGELIVPQTIAEEIRALLTRVSADTQVNYINPISDEHPATHVLITDASKKKYAGSLIDVKTGRVHILEGEFKLERKRSEDAEPHAITALISRFSPLLKGTRLLIASDHEGFVGAFKKGMSLHGPYSICLLAIKKVKQLEIATVKHVPGARNAMDAPSRGGLVCLQAIKDSLQAIGVESADLWIHPSTAGSTSNI
jgi:hypothetical protein